MSSVLKSEKEALFHAAKITLRFRGQVLGGIPKNMKMLDYFMEARQMSDAAKADLVQRVKDGALTDDEKAELKEMAWCTFERDPNGYLCLWHGNVKAMLREVFVTLGLTQKAPKKRGTNEDGGERSGAAGGRQTLQHGVHVDGIEPATEFKTPYSNLRILFLRDGKPLTQEDGSVDRVKHISDASGMRSALGRHDYLNQVDLSLVLKWPRQGVFTHADIRKALALAEDDGLGACRSQGFGKFDVVEYCEVR